MALGQSFRQVKHPILEIQKMYFWSVNCKGFPATPQMSSNFPRFRQEKLFHCAPYTSWGGLIASRWQDGHVSYWIGRTIIVFAASVVLGQS